MRGCFLAVLVIVGLFLVLIVGAFTLTAVVRPVERRAVVVQYQGDGRSGQAIHYEKPEGPDESTDQYAASSHAVYRKAGLLGVIALLLLVPAGLIILLIVLAMACRGSGARVQCERSRSAGQMRTLEELRAGIEKMAGRVESLETILLSARPGRQ